MIRSTLNNNPHHVENINVFSLIFQLPARPYTRNSQTVATISIHSLYWPNTAPRIVEGHRQVFDSFKIPINYTCESISHGQWMNDVLTSAKTDIVLFADIDCVPTLPDVVWKVASKALEMKSFCGPAQSTNCIQNRSHIFAAPSFLAVYVETYRALGSPSMLESSESDVAQLLSIIADMNHVQYCALFPTSFEFHPDEGEWFLGNYGRFGIGTYYPPGIYHLYQGRTQRNALLFSKRCRDIVSGVFSTREFKDCRHII